MDAKSVVTAATQAVESSRQWFRASLGDDHHAIFSLPGSNKTQDTAYVVLAKTESGWKFDRFLMEEEINAILARRITPTTTVEEGKK